MPKKQKNVKKQELTQTLKNKAAPYRLPNLSTVQYMSTYFKQHLELDSKL